VALLARPFKKREAALPVGPRISRPAEFAPDTPSTAEPLPVANPKPLSVVQDPNRRRQPRRPAHLPPLARRLGKPGWWRVRLGSRERGGRGSSSVFVCV